MPRLPASCDTRSSSEAEVTTSRTENRASSARTWTLVMISRWPPYCLTWPVSVLLPASGEMSATLSTSGSPASPAHQARSRSSCWEAHTCTPATGVTYSQQGVTRGWSQGCRSALG